MLDDLGYIHQKDVEDALGVVAKQAAQLRENCTLQGNVQFGEIHNVVYAAMGGSALAALSLHSWPGMAKSFEIVRDYDLPAYVDDKTLVIVASYSGNTEETLSALEQAEVKGAQIAVIAGGGKLLEAAQTKHYALAVLSKAEQPRYAVLYGYKALITLLEQAGVLAAEKVTPEVEEAANFLDESIKAWLPTVPTAQNAAKQLAQELLGKSLVVYSGPKLFASAYKWKISCNENAKHIAWTNQFPEFNHNEFIGWSKQPVDKPYAVVELRSNLEHPRVQKRFEVTERLLSGLRPSPHVVNAEGETLLEQLLWTSALGDFTTIYLALLGGIDPAPVDLVENFKKAMAEQ